MGVGLNVNFLPGHWQEIAGIATSVQAELGKPFSRLELLRQILRRFDHHYRRMKKGEDKDLKGKLEPSFSGGGKEGDRNLF